jgi:hypothetical protein
MASRRKKQKNMPIAKAEFLTTSLIVFLMIKYYKNPVVLFVLLLLLIALIYRSYSRNKKYKKDAKDSINK